MPDLKNDVWVTIIDRPGFNVAVMNLTDGPSRCTNNPTVRIDSQIYKGICVSPRKSESQLTKEDKSLIKSYGFNPSGDWFVPGQRNNPENCSISYECRDGKFWNG
jgi:hypothetical protein